jgi:hypothetical protein
MLGRISVICFFLITTIDFSIAATPSIKGGPYKKLLPNASFTALDVTGNINLHLHTGYAKSGITLHGDSRNLMNIKLERSPEGVLCITAKKQNPRYGVVSADIHTRYLNGLVYHGKGIIRGENLHANLIRMIIDNQDNTTLGGAVRLGYLEVLGSGYVQISGVTTPYLRVKLADHAKVKITGTAALKQLDAGEDSWFSLSWVKTPTLTIRETGKSYIQLAGIVNKLDVELWNYSQLNARYLRALTFKSLEMGLKVFRNHFL